MSKPVGHLETQVDLVLQQAIDTILTRWANTKLQTDSGIGPIGTDLNDKSDRHKILKVILRRAMAMNQRGSVGRGARATNITAGTVAL
jgi:hypothetical protein